MRHGTPLTFYSDYAGRKCRVYEPPAPGTNGSAPRDAVIIAPASLADVLTTDGVPMIARNKITGNHPINVPLIGFWLYYADDPEKTPLYWEDFRVELGNISEI